MAFRGDLAWAAAPAYMAVQMAAAVVGVILAGLMFDTPALAWSSHARTGSGQWLGEFIAAFGLLAVIWIGSKRRPASVPALVAAYIGSAYWFTSSTSFANPAVTVARMLTDTFTGIRPADAPGFILAQCLGAVAAVVVCRLPVPGAALPAADATSPASSSGVQSQPEHLPPARRRGTVRPSGGVAAG